MKAIKVLMLTTALVAGPATTQTVLAHPYSLDDELLQMEGQFEVGNGDTQTIVNNKSDGQVRICVRKVRDSIPLKVEHDGKETLVTPGNCSDVEGKHISVAPAQKLDKDMVLIGKYHLLG